MSSALTAIESVLNNPPFSLLTAYQWYSDYPTNSDATFSGTGYFQVHSGVDPTFSRPWGFVYELHNVPTGSAYFWRDAIVYRQNFGHIVNLGKLAGGYGSTIPVEDIPFDRPRGAFKFQVTSTDEFTMEITNGAFVELWGLYIAVPLITPTQMDWHSTGTGAPSFTPTLDGTTFTGLSGHGSFALDSGSVGVRIAITTLPYTYGETLADPEFYEGIGWINFGDAAGFQKRQYINHNGQELFSAGYPSPSVVGYSFEQNTIINATCLLPNVPLVS